MAYRSQRPSTAELPPREELGRNPATHFGYETGRKNVFDKSIVIVDDLQNLLFHSGSCCWAAWSLMPPHSLRTPRPTHPPTHPPPHTHPCTHPHPPHTHALWLSWPGGWSVAGSWAGKSAVRQLALRRLHRMPSVSSGLLSLWRVWVWKHSLRMFRPWAAWSLMPPHSPRTPGPTHPPTHPPPHTHPCTHPPPPSAHHALEPLGDLSQTSHKPLGTSRGGTSELSLTTVRVRLVLGGNLTQPMDRDVVCCCRVED